MDTLGLPIVSRVEPANLSDPPPPRKAVRMTSATEYRILASAIAGRVLGSFATQREAQAFYNETGGPVVFARGLYGAHRPQVVDCLRAVVRAGAGLDRVPGSQAISAD